MTTFRADDALLEGVATVARTEDRNMSGALRLLVREALQARRAYPERKDSNNK
jgi:hypothetical protein